MTKNGIGYQYPLFVVGCGSEQADQLTLFLVGPYGLFDLVFVVLDNMIGRFNNCFGGAVILFQPDQCMIGIIIFEVEDVLDVCSSESVNTLCIIANHTDIF